MAEPVEDDTVSQLRANDAEVWTWFVKTHAQPSLDTIRRSLSRQLRRRVDAEDILQDALQSLVVWLRKYDGRCRDGPQVASVFRILLTHRLADQLRRSKAHRRDREREVAAPSGAVGEDSPMTCVIDFHKGPDEIACLRDNVRGLIERLRPRLQIVMHRDARGDSRVAGVLAEDHQTLVV
jgi:DNA-directed RNA polymerase specialized sigma24 family protein